MGKQIRNVFVFHLQYSTLVACNKTSTSYLNQQKYEVYQVWEIQISSFFKHSKKTSTLILIILLPKNTTTGKKSETWQTNLYTTMYNTALKFRKIINNENIQLLESC